MDHNQKTEQKSILIVGDWVIDEYWFVVTHQSQISSHTGFSHYRIASERGEQVINLCGAGDVAQTIYKLNQGFSPKDRYNLIGLGKWNIDDTKFISHLVHCKNEELKCPVANVDFRIMNRFCAYDPEIRLITLDDKSPTIRVIRQYHQCGDEIKQLSRIDWEPPQPKPGKNDQLIFSIPDLDGVEHIIIHDLTKGCVTEDFILSIQDRFPKAKWYIRSKEKNPKWLPKLNNIELLMIGPEVAESLNPWQSWLAKDRATKEAIDVIRKMPGNHVVLLSDERELIARVNEKQKCITARSLVPPSPITMLGWPSAVFANLINQLIHHGTEISKDMISKIMKLADDTSGVPLPKNSTLYPPPLKDPTVIDLDWKDETQEWEQAIQGMGIITDKNGRMNLDVWRGATHLPGYIAMSEKKQEIIDRIGRNMISFSREATPIRSMSILLQADPGAGKTFLAKTLADKFDFRMLPYDLTQMVHRDELHDLFDSIANMQAKNNEPILVFVDEINAKLNGSHVYGAFLAPLEESYYFRHGKNFSLRPCVWMFAGTKLDEEKLDSGDKLSDFKSRMTMIEKIDFQSLKETYDNQEKLILESRLEQVYLGAIMLKSSMPDVSIVDYEVLHQFYQMNPSESPARSILKRVASLSNVQYGAIKRSNCDNWGTLKWIDDEKGKKPVRLRY